MSTTYPQKRAMARQPEGTCYRVLMWEACAVDEQHMQAWKDGRTRILAAMRDAGIKGARGKLSIFEKELKTLIFNNIEKPLTKAVRAGFSFARADALAEALSTDNAVLAYRLGTAAAEVLVHLDGSESPESMAERWQANTTGMEWEAQILVEALNLREAALWQEESRSAEQEATEATAAASDAEFHHVTVLAAEAVQALQPGEGKVLVDATLGGGGHTERMLQAGAEVWGIDQDPVARAASAKRLAPYAERLHIVAGNFRNAVQILRQHGVEQVDGILADIGISSPQVDCAERGFSFLNEGPLDMRMNPATAKSAADIVNHAAESEIADILWQYGEERASRAIARRIVQERAKAPITTTTQLADIIAGVLPRKGKQHPATRSFQALRIAVNDELGALEELLRTGLSLLKSGGRFAIITFHSLEDRAVKRYFELVTKAEIDRPEWPAPRPNPEYAAKAVYRKPVIPGDEELAANPRSRSAKLRVIEKL
ncbi:MAG: 16S rRNA (cytosine(1402)-N(4))-methyltransferase RsmH [Akkermansia sp.]|nr:16S rRNA (cytosine(1402)-N(4))-methyltransferase RsmH [Akkermansia sp.]